jgi:hypothetical protein
VGNGGEYNDITIIFDGGSVRVDGVTDLAVGRSGVPVTERHKQHHTQRQTPATRQSRATDVYPNTIDATKRLIVAQTKHTWLQRKALAHSMKFHSATIGTTLFMAGLAIGFGTHSALSPTKTGPVGIASSHPHTATPAEHTDIPTPAENAPDHALAMPDLEALVAEATALRTADQKAMSDRYNTYRRPIPDDWESIKALAIEEKVGEPGVWDYLDRLQAELDRLLREEPDNSSDIKLRRDTIQIEKDVIVKRLQNHLRVPLDEATEYRDQQTGDFRYNRIVDALLGPEKATLCAKDDTSCTQPIRVNFLCDMSQILVCHQIARTIRASEDFFLMYPFDARNIKTSLNWDITLIYSDFGKKSEQTNGIYSLFSANSHSHEADFVLDINEQIPEAIPETLDPMMYPNSIIGSYRIEAKKLEKFFNDIKLEKNNKN